MYKFLLVLLALGVLAPPKLRAAEIASPTVIVDIHALGFEKLADLKSAPGVRWSAEFGNELLMGVAPEDYSSWLNHPRAKAGLGNLALDEILVRDHVCTHACLQPALGIVGGYEIMRLPPALARYARLTGLNAQPLPESRVMSRESLNEPDFRRAPSTPDPIISRIVGKVNADRWYLTMSGLSLFNRNSFSPNLSASRDWILSQFASANLTTSVFNFTLSNITSCSPLPAAIELTNPIGTKLGAAIRMNGLWWAATTIRAIRRAAMACSRRSRAQTTTRRAARRLSSWPLQCSMCRPIGPFYSCVFLAKSKVWSAAAVTSKVCKHPAKSLG